MLEYACRLAGAAPRRTRSGSRRLRTGRLPGFRRTETKRAFLRLRANSGTGLYSSLPAPLRSPAANSPSCVPISLAPSCSKTSLCRATCAMARVPRGVRLRMGEMRESLDFSRHFLGGAGAVLRRLDWRGIVSVCGTRFVWKFGIAHRIIGAPTGLRARKVRIVIRVMTAAIVKQQQCFVTGNLRQKPLNAPTGRRGSNRGSPASACRLFNCQRTGARRTADQRGAAGADNCPFLGRVVGVSVDRGLRAGC